MLPSLLKLHAEAAQCLFSANLSKLIPSFVLQPSQSLIASSYWTQQNILAFSPLVVHPSPHLEVSQAP